MLRNFFFLCLSFWIQTRIYAVLSSDSIVNNMSVSLKNILGEQQQFQQKLLCDLRDFYFSSERNELKSCQSKSSPFSKFYSCLRMSGTLIQNKVILKFNNTNHERFILVARICATEKCYNEYYPIQANSLENMITLPLDAQVMMIHLHKDLGDSGVFNCDQKMKYESKAFGLNSFSIPFVQKAGITQCYKGNYSHAQTFAIDFTTGAQDKVVNAREGIVLDYQYAQDLECQLVKKVDQSFIMLFARNGMAMSLNKDWSSRFGCFWDTSYNAYQCNQVPYACHQPNFVRILHNDNTISTYLHLSGSIDYLRLGDLLTKRGIMLGYVGQTGFTSGAHLHFEVGHIQWSLMGSKQNSSTLSLNLKSIPTMFIYDPESSFTQMESSVCKEWDAKQYKPIINDSVSIALNPRSYFLE